MDTVSDDQSRESNHNCYKHPSYECELDARGSFMASYKGSLHPETKPLCHKLLNAEQTPPKGTLFDDDCFERTLDSIKGRIEARVVRDIAQLIVPPA